MKKLMFFLILNVSVLNYFYCQTLDASDKEVQRLFSQEEVIDLRISGDLMALLADRGDDPENHSMEISYQDENSQTISSNLKIKTRGNFRRKKENCYYPPLLLDFPKSKVPENSLFYSQNKLKLVTPCKGEKYVIREYLIYKLYQIISEKGFQARLVRVTFHDQKKDKSRKPVYGFILEDEDQMAARNQAKIIKPDRLAPEQTNTGYFFKMAVFQYLIGNTDWSVQYRHNIKLLDDGSGAPFPVPYDFDHAGLVNAPYAKPAAELELAHIRKRRYRGYCVNEEKELFQATLDFYQEIKPDLYKVYENNSLINKKYIRSSLKYLDDFYSTIDSTKKREQAFSYPCNPTGTGNVVIKGLNK